MVADLTLQDVQGANFWLHYNTKYAGNGAVLPGIRILASFLPAGSTEETMGCPFPIAHLSFSGSRIHSEYGQENVMKLLEKLYDSKYYLDLLGKAKIPQAAVEFVTYIRSTMNAIAASAARNCLYLHTNPQAKLTLKDELYARFTKISKSNDKEFVSAIALVIPSFADETVVSHICKKWISYSDSIISNICQGVLSVEDAEVWVPLAKRISAWLEESTAEISSSLDASTLKEVCQVLAKLDPEKSLPVLAQVAGEMASKKDIPRFLAAIASIKAVRQKMPILRESILGLLSGSNEVKEVLLETVLG